MDYSSEEEEEEEEGKLSPYLQELVRTVLKKKKKSKTRKEFERDVVAELLEYDINDGFRAAQVDVALKFLEEVVGVKAYKDLKQEKTKEEELEQALATSTLNIGIKGGIRRLYKLMNTKLPARPLRVGRCGGSGTQDMTPELRASAPSQQVATDHTKHVQAAEAFYQSVMDVETVVEDTYILQAFLIANGRQTYITDSEDKKILVDDVAPGLAAKLDGRHHRTLLNEDGVPMPVKKMAKMDEVLLNADGTTLEDARSGNFAKAWNHNIMLTKYAVQACPQIPAHKVGDSTKKADIILDLGGKGASEGGFKDSTDYVTVMEWKNNYVKGADREGTVYALLIQEGINRKRFLVFSVAPGAIEVFGVYWKEGDKKARRVKLAHYHDSATKFFQEWLEVMLYFSRESPRDIHTPTIPRFDTTATESEMFTHNVFKVKIQNEEGENKWYIYKVYDYVNRKRIPVEERRWLNWELVQEYYPDPELVVNLPALKIFRYPFQYSGEGSLLLHHVPLSIESFIAIGEDLERLHKSGWIWGDVRLANMLFIGAKAYMIDLDFARKVSDNAKYPIGYLTERLPRHAAARAGEPMQQSHDVYSFWRCFQILCGTGVECPGNKMGDILPSIRGMKDKYIRPDPKDINELSLKTGAPAKEGALNL